MTDARAQMQLPSQGGGEWQSQSLGTLYKDANTDSDELLRRSGSNKSLLGVALHIL